jgi:hypothetical protein
MSTGNLQNSTISAFNNISTAPIVVAGVNASRTKITFHNPGGVDIVVFPTTVLQGTPGGGSVTLVPTTALLGGGFRIFANGGEITREGAAAKQAWQALSVTGSGNPLTVMEVPT